MNDRRPLFCTKEDLLSAGYLELDSSVTDVIEEIWVPIHNYSSGITIYFDYVNSDGSAFTHTYSTEVNSRTVYFRYGQYSYDSTDSYDRPRINAGRNYALLTFRGKVLVTNTSGCVDLQTYRVNYALYDNTYVGSYNFTGANSISYSSRSYASSGNPVLYNVSNNDGVQYVGFKLGSARLHSEIDEHPYLKYKSGTIPAGTVFYKPYQAS